MRRRVTTVPFNRVQHAAVNTGPLDRYFGLARLEVYTAGGQTADLSLEGLPHCNCGGSSACPLIFDIRMIARAAGRFRRPRRCWP